MKNPILPSSQTFYNINEAKHTLNLEAIAIFAAIGFFLDKDTYWHDEQVITCGANFDIRNQQLVSEDRYFNWHYSPRNISLEQATNEFTDLFESIVKEQTKDKRVILPLSGGLDSRTQAAALKNSGVDVQSYSYEFLNGLNETRFAGQIAAAENFPFTKFTVRPGYLWNCIDELALINRCYSEFTHPRQMAFISKYSSMGDIFSLGHMGDLMFDEQGVRDDLPFDNQVEVMVRKIVKKGGMELAESLWESWGLQGNFKAYLYSRVRDLLLNIAIPNNANARIRAFKSMYWVPRWTSVNLSIFESVNPISLPYFDDRMCEFICTIPEKHLSGRQIQIEYLKRRAPELAKITWQDHRPFNLYYYKLNRFPYNLPSRISSKLKRTLQPKKYIMRNWELQFLGKENDRHLQDRLFFEPHLLSWVPQKIIEDFYQKFKTKDAVTYSHPISMLLTLSLFSKHFKDSKP